MTAPNIPTYLVWAIAYALVLFTSGFVVRFALWMAETSHPSQKEKHAGFVIGKIENILIVSFALLGDLTAPAVVFAAKGLIRSSVKGQNSYLVVGTLANFAWSLVIAGSALLYIESKSGG